MALTSLDAVRQWCNADDIGGVDDERLQLMVDAAEDYVVTATGRTKDEILKMGDGVNLPPQLTAAICSLAADWYDYREASNTQERKPTQVFTAIIKQFRKLADPVSGKQEGGES
jgi:hypothetical protein